MENFLQTFSSFDVARGEFEKILLASGVDFKDFGWDDHDGSLELYGVSVRSNLSGRLQEILYDSGFRKAYLNYDDGRCAVYDWYSLTKTWPGPVDPKSASFKKKPK